MATVKATEIEVNDFVIVPNTEDVKGIVTKVQVYGNERYIQIVSEDGGNRNYRRLVNDTMEKLKATLELKTVLNAIKQQTMMKTVAWVGGHIGSDPEMFVVDKNNNEMIPAFDFLGSEKAPDRVKAEVNDHGNGQALFWDGFQAEFNAEANGCLAWTVDSVHAGIKTLREKALGYNKNARLTIQPTLEVPIDMLMEGKPEHIDFGCSPSLNVYGMKGLKMNGREVPFRSAGGHIHFGISESNGFNKEKAALYVKALDKILGVACVSLFNKYDDPKRRVLYGLAGEYRLPKHGLEYRTLSNAWMSHPLIMNIVFDLSRKVIGAEAAELMEFWDATEEETIECINNCDVDLSRRIIKRNKVMLKNLIKSCYYDATKVSAVYKIILHGMDVIIEKPDDVEGNWLSGNYRSHCEGHGHNVAHIEQNKLFQKVNDLEE